MNILATTPQVVRGKKKIVFFLGHIFFYFIMFYNLTSVVAQHCNHILAGLSSVQQNLLTDVHYANVQRSKCSSLVPDLIL